MTLSSVDCCDTARTHHADDAPEPNHHVTYDSPQLQDIENLLLALCRALVEPCFTWLFEIHATCKTVAALRKRRAACRLAWYFSVRNVARYERDTEENETRNSNHEKPPNATTVEQISSLWHKHTYPRSRRRVPIQHDTHHSRIGVIPCPTRGILRNYHRRQMRRIHHSLSVQRSLR